MFTCVFDVANFLRLLADIIFIVKDKEHPSFRRDGNNLIYTTSIPLGKVTWLLITCISSSDVVCYEKES